MKNNSSPRYLALKTLLSAEKNGKYINLASDAELNSANMSAQDKALFTSLVYGVTERRITLDYIIAAMSSRGTSHIEPRVMGILRLGLYQIIYLDKIPVHAAVNETVALTKNKGEGSFVNAILRNYIRDGQSRVLFPKKEDSVSRYLSVRYSFPEWICESLIADYGAEDAEGILMAFSSSAPAPTLRANTLVTDKEALIRSISEAGIECDCTPYSPYGIKLSHSTNVTTLEGFSDGAFFVQDEASQISTKVLDPQAGETIIDTCSCPGSKSFGAAIEMKNEGKVYSFDLHKNKLSLVSSSAKRLHINIIEANERDARESDPSLLSKADRVICDVPCSGLGVMAKKPDIRYKSEEDIKKLPALGLEILKQSAQYLRKGGVLLYSTCTLKKDENELTVQKFLEAEPSFSLCPFTVPSRDPDTPDIVSDGMLTLMPHIHKTDGFFIAKLIKNH